MSEETDSGSPPVDVALLIRQEEHPSLDAIRAYATEHAVELEEIGYDAFLEASSADLTMTHWVVAVDDDAIPPILKAARGRDVQLGLVSTPGSELPRLFDLPRAIDDQVALAFSGEGTAVDLTCCNGEPVMALAAIGDVPFFDRRGHAFVRAQATVWRRWRAAARVFRIAVGHLFAIHPISLRLQIGDDEAVRNTAVTGIVVLEHDAERLGGSLGGESLSACDGRLSALLLAPASVVAYLMALGRAAFGGNRRAHAVSLIKTTRLVIESDVDLPYSIDGHRRSARRLEFTVEPQAVAIKAGEGFAAANPSTAADRDTLQLKTLPENEARLALIRRRLPLFTHALEEDFKELFQLLRESARVTTDYVMLTLGATLLAALGLVLNSPAVIIGAMILAPLMAPIVSLAMAALRRDERLLQSSLKTIGVGVALALAVAALMAWIIPLRRLTPEIDARLHPSLLDLGVAVVSGVAGAYAYARENIMKTLPGVAIAVALVPPLAVAGIGIGWAEPRVFGGAMLLFLTNLVGIASTAALTFLVLGYAPIQTAARGLRTLALALLLLSLPLYLSFRHIADVWQLESQLQNTVLKVAARDVELLEPEVRVVDGTAVVRATAVSSQPLSSADMDVIKQQLEQRLGRRLRIELDVRLVR